MDAAWKLAAGETIVGCVVPANDPWRMPVCAECGQVAYRVVEIATEGQQKRAVPLCGGHFISACLRLPELSKYNRGGKIG